MPSTSSEPASYAPIQLSISGVTSLLWPFRRLILHSAAAGLCAGICVAFLIPNFYESITKLMPPDQNRASGLSALIASSAKAPSGLDTAAELLGGTGQKTGNLFLVLLRSNTVLDRIIERFDLAGVYGEDLPEDTRAKLVSRTVVAQDSKSGVITITVLDKDPNRAAAIARAYVEELNTTVVGHSTSDAKRERVFLESRLGLVNSDLLRASNDLSEFAGRNTTLDPEVQGKAIVEAAAVLQGQVIAGKSELQQLEQIYTPTSARVRAARARVAALESELHSLVGKPGSPSDGGSIANPEDGEGPPETARAESISPSIRQLPRLGATYAELYRRLKVQETIFEVLTKEYELAKVQEAKDVPTVQMLDAPQIPLRHASPNRLFLALAGLLFGLAVPIGFVLMRKNWDMLEHSHPEKRFLAELLDHARMAARNRKPGKGLLGFFK